MNNKAHPQTSQHQFTYVPSITTAAMPLLLFGRKKKNETSEQSAQQTPLPKPKKWKPKGTAVGKYEIAEDKVKFSIMKGFAKKRWVIVKEFPIYEITAVESIKNWISFTWKGEAYPFVLKKKTDSFVKLQEQIQGMQEENQKALQKKEHAALRKTELLGAVNTVLPIVDSSFDILIGLHGKRVNWTRIEGYMQTFANPLSFKAQTLMPLDIDFANVSAAAKAQAAKDTSKETFAVLKAIHDYFNAFKPEEDAVDTSPNFEQTKTLVSAYYTLNDLFLAKAVGEKDSIKELSALEGQLKDLADKTSFKLSIEELKQSLNAPQSEEDSGDTLSDARLLFREQLKLL